MKIIIFDIDGTLLSGAGAGKLAFEKIFLELFQKEKVWKNIIPDGKTDPIIMDELARMVLGRELTQEEHHEMALLYVQYFQETIKQVAPAEIKPGIERLLGRLAEKKIPMGIATGNFEIPAWLKLEQAGLSQFFSFGGFGSDSRNRVELTRVALKRGRDSVQGASEFLLVGDSIHDIHAAKALSIPILAVATGKTAQQDLKKEAPDFFLNDLSDTKKVLDIMEVALEHKD